MGCRKPPAPRDKEIMNNGGEVLPPPLIIWHRQQFLSAITPIIFEYSSIFLMFS